jgi:hypothetical protein
MNTKNLRRILVPKGKKPLVRLDLNNKFFEHSFVEQCINQIEISSIMGSSLNPLEKLGLIIILDSAGVKEE